MKMLKNMVLYGMLLLSVVGIWFTFGNKTKEAQGFTVAVAAGTPFETKAHLFKNVTEVRLYDDDNRTFNELVNEKVDVVITDRLRGLNCIKNAGYPNLKLAGDLLYRETTAVAFIPEDKALRQKVNQALVSIIHDGTFARISRKYFGRDILKGFNRDFTYPDEPVSTDESWKRIKQRSQIRFAMSYGYPPFNYFDENNQFTGFDIEIARAVCKNLGVEFIPVITAWEGIGEGLWGRRYDGVWGIATNTSEWLNNEVEFSDPFYFSGAQLFVCVDSPITGPETLQKEDFQGLFSLPKLIPDKPNLFND